MTTDSREDAFSPDSDNGIARALKDQLSLVSSFEQWLARRTQPDDERNNIIARVQRRLDSYQRWLLEAQQTPADLSEDADPWAMDARIRSESNGETVVVVSGPGVGEPIEIAPKDEEDMRYLMSDNYLGYMIKICHAFAKAQDTFRSLLQVTRETEQERSQLSQPPETTVQTYIRRLQEYNEIKDIGQQLIGLIAENRGVPVRTLYENGEYGVGMPR